MGVMACGRNGCESIMCSRMVLGGYICGTCWDELCQHKETWPERLTKTDVEARITAFMETRPGAYIEMDRNEAFDLLTEENTDD